MASFKEQIKSKTSKFYKLVALDMNIKNEIESQARKGFTSAFIPYAAIENKMLKQQQRKLETMGFTVQEGIFYVENSKKKWFWQADTKTEYGLIIRW